MDQRPGACAAAARPGQHAMVPRGQPSGSAPTNGHHGRYAEEHGRAREWLASCLLLHNTQAQPGVHGGAGDDQVWHRRATPHAVHGVRAEPHRGSESGGLHAEQLGGQRLLPGRLSVRARDSAAAAPQLRGEDRAAGHVAGGLSPSDRAARGGSEYSDVPRIRSRRDAGRPCDDGQEQALAVGHVRAANLRGPEDCRWGRRSASQHHGPGGKGDLRSNLRSRPPPR